MTTNAVKTSMKSPVHRILVAKDSGSTKLEVMPSGAAAAGILDRLISGGREVIFADHNPVWILWLDGQLTGSYVKKW